MSAVRCLVPVFALILGCAAFTAGCGGGGGHDDWPPDDAVEVDVLDHDVTGDAGRDVHTADANRDGTGDDAAVDAAGDTAGNDVMTGDTVGDDPAAGDTHLDGDEPDAADAAGSDISGSDVPQPDGLDAPDNLLADALDTDAPCEPECGAAACGPDPVCGMSCGSCWNGLTCIGGACIAMGCYNAAAQSCVDRFTFGSGSGPDPAQLQAMCESEGGTWQVCPTADLVATLHLVGESGASYNRNFYAPLYCSLADATAQARRDNPAATITTVWSDPAAACDGETTDSVACVFSDSLDPYCIELAGGVPLSKAQAWAAWCTDAAGGVLALTCPGRETGNCEEPPPTGATFYTLTHYYAESPGADHQPGCEALGGTWLVTECQQDSIPYGDCILNALACSYAAGAFQQLYYDMTITETVTGHQGYTCCYAALEGALDAAFADLTSRDDLSRCIPPQ